VLLGGAFACAVVSVAQFRLGSRVTEATVILVIDSSRSMQQTDVDPDRLTAAENAARAFLQRLPPGFRVGLVTFSADATQLVAPTTDRGEVDRALGSLPESLSGGGTGTVIGDGLSASLNSLEADWRANGSGPSAIVLLSDGLDTGSRVPPAQAADRATRLGTRVFTVALGEAGVSGGDAGANIGLLQQIAEATDGRTFTAQTAGELNQVYETLGSRLSYDLAISHLGAVFLVAATVLAFAAGGVAIAASRRRY
jgi:Ca-activated chloride channel family protein